MTFPCEKCGACCRHLDRSPLYKPLDAGDGVCRYLRGNLCSIYDSRPLLCRVDDCYDAFFSGQMTREEFYALNQKVCRELKKR